MVKVSKDEAKKAVEDFKFQKEQFQKEQYPPLKTPEESVPVASVPVTKIRDPKVVQEVVDQSNRILERLKPEVDASLSDAIKDICLKDKFDIDGYPLEWNRMSRRLVDKLDNILTLKDLPTKLKDATDADKQEWLMQEYYKLIYKGFTEDMYFEMSIPALKVLEQAPYSRMAGLFRRPEG